MTHDRRQQLKLRAGELNAAVSLLLTSLERDIDVITAQLQDATLAGTSEDSQRLNEQRDSLSMDLSVLRDQVATLERLASQGARQGRETAAQNYITELAQAFLLAVDDIKGRAKLILSPSQIERLPAWEVEAARMSVTDAEHTATLLWRVLHP